MPGKTRSLERVRITVLPSSQSLKEAVEFSSLVVFAGEALIKEAHSYFEQALQSGVLSSASRSLAIRVDEEKTTIEKLKAQYEKENGLIYFEPAKKMEGVPEGKEITATDFTPYVPPTAVTFHVV
mmetsp:Transcript_21686/g.71732  ORF Transcript_21686/g.71732 Transcript_21686/m.71732 type:complete len:125 (-) Transcript_21686:248-622(-)